MSTDTERCIQCSSVKEVVHANLWTTDTSHRPKMQLLLLITHHASFYLVYNKRNNWLYIREAMRWLADCFDDHKEFPFSSGETQRLQWALMTALMAAIKWGSWRRKKQNRTSIFLLWTSEMWTHHMLNIQAIGATGKYGHQEYAITKTFDV